MNRRTFVAGTGTVLLAAPLAAQAQTGKVPRIGVVAPAGLRDPDIEAFRQGLRELGYVEGQNLLVQYRAAEGEPERFPDLFGEILRLKVDVIVTGSLSAALAREPPEALLVFSDPLTLNHQSQIMDFATQHRPLSADGM